jgi:hypothetical protein
MGNRQGRSVARRIAQAVFRSPIKTTCPDEQILVGQKCSHSVFAIRMYARTVFSWPAIEATRLL